MTKPLCISYIRFSSPSQSSGTSIERQLELSRKYAYDHGFVLDETLSKQDHGKSAFSGDHIRTGHFGVFLDLVEQGKIPQDSILLVESLDRLSRDKAYEAFMQFQNIINKGIKVVTLCDGTEYTKESLSNNISQLMMSLTIMVRANEESALKSERILAGFHIKRQNLANIKFTGNCPSWLKLTHDKRNFETIPDKVAVLKRIFEMSYSGLGIKAIERQLNKEHIPALRTKNGWCYGTIRKLLSSRSVIGEFQPHTFNKKDKKPVPIGDVVKGYFPQIIEDDLFYAVQARLSNGSHISGRTARVDNLFGGITHCGYCGGRMDIVSKGKLPKQTKYLVCDNARRGIKCSYISFNCNELEDAFLSYCRELDIYEVLKLEGVQDKKNIAELNHQISVKSGELCHFINLRDNLNEELYATTDTYKLKYVIDRAGEVEQKISTIKHEIEIINKEINKATASSDGVDSKINNILELVASFKKSTSDEEIIEFRIRLRNELRQLIAKVIVYPRGDVATNEQIQELILKFESKISKSDDLHKDMYRDMRDTALEKMRESQTNTKDARYFEIHFKNNNFRRIHYSKERKTYEVSFDRTGNRLNWTMFGEQLPTIELENESEQIKAEVEYYRKKHPEMTSEQAANMEKALHEAYNAESYEDESSPPMAHES